MRWGQGGTQSVPSPEKVFDVSGLGPESGHDRDVDILGQSGLSPSLNREGSDDAETPVPCPAKTLDLERRAENRIQGRKKPLGFLRLSVNSAVFPHPLDPETALRKVDTWLGLEVARPLGEKENHWEVLRPLLAASGMAGNLTTDAYLAALAISHDAVLVSFDNDFSRFDGLRWESPG